MSMVFVLQFSKNQSNFRQNIIYNIPIIFRETFWVTKRTQALSRPPKGLKSDTTVKSCVFFWKMFSFKCVVCGDKASGYHYNVLSCEGCKGSGLSWRIFSRFNLYVSVKTAIVVFNDAMRNFSKSQNLFVDNLFVDNLFTGFYRRVVTDPNKMFICKSGLYSSLLDANQFDFQTLKRGRSLIKALR